MLPQGISGFASFLAKFTNISYIKMRFTMSLHVSTIGKFFTTGSTSVLHVDRLTSCIFTHNDHRVQKSG